jgi:sugar lactone lactonase YvrE
VDIRDELSPHPCLDFFVFFDPKKLTRKNVFMNVLRHADKIVCSPAGVAFDKEGDSMYYADRVTKKIIKFEYDQKEGEIGKKR